MIDDATMMHGRDWAGEDLAGWYLSEKLHGCRAYWDGSAMWSRGGCEIAIPAAWHAELPTGIALDCEIYAGIGGFKKAQAATVYGKFVPPVRIVAFDANVPGTLLERQAIVTTALEGARHARAITRLRCRSTACALDWLRHVRAAGGEGLVAVHPANVYAAGRTTQILKLAGAASRTSTNHLERTHHDRY